MDFVPSAKELSHFPFLKKAQDYIKAKFSSLDSLLKDPKGEALITRAIERIKEAISQKKYLPRRFLIRLMMRLPHMHLPGLLFPV